MISDSTPREICAWTVSRLKGYQRQYIMLITSTVWASSVLEIALVIERSIEQPGGREAWMAYADQPRLVDALLAAERELLEAVKVYFRLAPQPSAFRFNRVPQNLAEVLPQIKAEAAVGGAIFRVLSALGSIHAYGSDEERDLHDLFVRYGRAVDLEVRLNLAWAMRQVVADLWQTLCYMAWGKYEFAAPAETRLPEWPNLNPRDPERCRQLAAHAMSTLQIIELFTSAGDTFLIHEDCEACHTGHQEQRDDCTRRGLAVARAVADFIADLDSREDQVLRLYSRTQAAFQEWSRLRTCRAALIRGTKAAVSGRVLPGLLPAVSGTDGLLGPVLRERSGGFRPAWPNAVWPPQR